MNFFDEAALRLKQQLQVKTDKEVAEALGLSAVAWVGRKKRENFPEVELYALAARRPELKIDVEYVLTGRAPQAMSAQGRDDYLMGRLAALEVVVQVLLQDHPQAKLVQDAFLQEIKSMAASLAGESLSDDFVRGLRAGETTFRLLPVGRSAAAATKPTSD